MADHDILIVSGLPRSGTSLMMRLIAQAGVVPLVDDTRPADTDNLGGYFEYAPVKMMREGNLSWLPLAAGRVIKIVSYLLDSLPPNLTYRIVFMQRNLVEIVSSQNAMLARRNEIPALSDEALIQLYSRHLHQIHNWLAAQPNIQTITVDYNRLVSEPVACIRDLGTFLDLQMDPGELSGIIDPKQYRQRAGRLSAGSASSGG